MFTLCSSTGFLISSHPPQVGSLPSQSCVPLTQFFPPLLFPPLSYFPLPLSLSLLLEQWHFSWNDGFWVSCPHQNWMAFSLCLRGEEQRNPQMPSFILFSISSTYPIYNSASFLADWHSTLLTSQNKGNSRIRGKSRLPGFFCSQAFVRSFSARIWEVSAGSCASLSPPSASWKVLPYRTFFLTNFPSWSCVDQAYINGVFLFP